MSLGSKPGRTNNDGQRTRDSGRMLTRRSYFPWIKTYTSTSCTLTTMDWEHTPDETKQQGRSWTISCSQVDDGGLINMYGGARPASKTRTSCTTLGSPCTRSRYHT